MAGENDSRAIPTTFQFTSAGPMRMVTVFPTFSCGFLWASVVLITIASVSFVANDLPSEIWSFWSWESDGNAMIVKRFSPLESPPCSPPAGVVVRGSLAFELCESFVSDPSVTNQPSNAFTPEVSRIAFSTLSIGCGDAKMTLKSNFLVANI